MKRAALATRLYTSGLMVAVPFALPWALWRWRRRLFKERLPGWASRVGWFPRALLTRLAVHRPWLWVHAASVGETLAFRPLMGRLRNAFPNARILFSAATREAVQLAETQGIGDAVTVAPLDFPWAVRRLLAAAEPRLVLLMETELWPNLIRLAKASGAKVAVVNGRISLKSFKRYRWVAPWFPQVLQGLDLCAMREPADAERIRVLGALPERVHVTGNLKYDAWLAASPQTACGSSTDGWGLSDDHVLWVAGSVHPQEVPIILDTFQALLASFPHCRLALTPRHLETLPSVIEAFEARALPYQRRSQGGRFSAQVRCVVVDTVGELSALYRLAGVAFVGGSLIPHGGQNVIEPALAKVPVLFGPHMANFRETAQLLERAEGAWEVNTQAALLDRVRTLLADPALAKTMGERAFQAIVSQQGAAERTTVLLQRLFV
ncbi:MAG: 3-deoxy-D-manno-octulosonic acid transferase [Elusimicrobia bacterium]|nr:3-deoxy-D-manno-octulosonic acid transferase [Elusimicrobiota bacterium]